MSTTSTNLGLTLQVGTEGKTGATDRLTVLNANWNILDALFHQTTGHDHTGVAGKGPTIAAAALASGAVTGPKIAMGSDAQGDILFRGSTSYQRLAASTSGRYLQTKGVGSDPVWASSAGDPLASQSFG